MMDTAPQKEAGGPAEPSSAAGLIVAGGASRRFGGDKARHPVEGVPLIARVYRALSATVCPVVVSIGADEPTYADVLPADVRYVRDRHADAGPMAGLSAGFEALDASWVLVAACDMPNVRPDGFDVLLDARSKMVDAVVGRAEGWLHPLFAAYRRGPTLAAVQAALAEETYALHALLDRLRVREVEVPSALVHNVNRQADLSGE